MILRKNEPSLLGAMGEVLMNNSLSRSQLNGHINGKRVLHYGDIHTKLPSHIKSVLDFPLANAEVLSYLSDKQRIKCGDVVLADASEDYNDVGKAVEFVKEPEEDTFAGLHTILFRPNPETFATGYLAYALQAWPMRLNIMRLSQGAKVLGLSKGYFQQLEIRPHELEEQKKIAGFLSAVDEKLAAVEAQLAGWRDYKRGMMQAFFSQRLRFKVDDGSTFPVWSNVKLEDRFSFHKTNSLSRAVLGLESDGIENIHYGDIHTKYRAQFDIRNESTGIVPNHLTDKAGEPLKKGDVIFADASEDYNDVGKAIEVINLDNSAVVAGLHTILARPKKDAIALGFAAYLFASWPLRKQLMRIANGASVLGISKTNLAKVDLTLPSLQEQQKIAEALSAIDAKIEALTVRQEATREFKRGLLQKMFV